MEPLTTGLMVGGSVLSGLMGSDASSDAAGEMADATRDAAEMQLTGMREALGQQMSMFDYGIGANAPYSGMGTSALGAMSQFLGMELPQADTRDYASELTVLQKKGRKNQRARDKLSKLESAGKLTDADIARWKALGDKDRSIQSKIEANKRGSRQQQQQQAALAQFQTSGEEGGGSGSGIQPLERFNFDFDESQLGQTDSYKFRQEQSLEALDRRLAAGGMRGSGNRYAGILEMASGLASTEYEAEYQRQYGRQRDEYSSQFDIYNLYSNMAGMGSVHVQNSANNAMQAGSNMASIIQQGYGGMANARMEGGQAAAAGQLGQANAFRGMFQDMAYIGGQAGWFDEE
jgi:hypothetical protein